MLPLLRELPPRAAQVPAGAQRLAEDQRHAPQVRPEEEAAPHARPAANNSPVSPSLQPRLPQILQRSSRIAKKYQYIHLPGKSLLKLRLSTSHRSGGRQGQSQRGSVTEMSPEPLRNLYRNYPFSPLARLPLRGLQKTFGQGPSARLSSTRRSTFSTSFAGLAFLSRPPADM
jgi:hypothetical protein